MSKTISFVKGKGSINHNNRDFTAKNVDASRTSMNVIYVQIPIEEAYEEIFGQAVADYNAKQKRSDRKIGNYLSKIKQSKNNEKVFYETVVQIGKRDDTGILDENGNITEDAMLAKEVLDEYARTFQERNPNLILFNAVLHMDEATPHLHLDYIPVAHGYKTGLKTRNSLTKGLQEMGIAPAIGKNDTETMHWQKREREHIAELCKARGIETEVLGIVRDNYTIPEYKAAMREKEAAEAEIEILHSEKEEAISLINATGSQIQSNYEVIDEQEEELKYIEKRIEEAELKIRAKQEEISSIVEAMKPSYAEIQEIESTLREMPELETTAAEWFHNKWGVPQEAYLECMEDYLNKKTEYGWYLCMDNEQIIGGLGVIENDFHDRKDLTPNVCAVYTDEAYRKQGIAGNLLNMAVEDLRSKGITPVYLVTDHTGFYERYGWEFLCMVQGDDEPDMTRMYIHR